MRLFHAAKWEHEVLGGVYKEDVFGSFTMQSYVFEGRRVKRALFAYQALKL